MRSIRKRLILWLLLGLSALWVAAGAGIYYTVRRSELTRLDAQLDKMENVARIITVMSGRHGGAAPAPGKTKRPDTRSRRMEERWPDFFEPTGSSFFQMWDKDGAVRNTSESLGERQLPFPVGVGQKRPRFYTTRLADGTQLRAKAALFKPPHFSRGHRQVAPHRPRAGTGAPITSVVAIDDRGMRQTLASLLLGIAGVGVAAAAASVTLVHFALKDGLRPLRKLGDQLAEIDARSLDGRFSSNDLPIEIAPVSDRLNALMGRLEKSFERERRFGADLAHELRTPVAELRTMAEVALRWPDGKDTDEAAATLEIAEQMGGIIESLLALARYENGQAEIATEPIALDALAAECWRPFASRATDRGLDVRLDLAAPPALDSDPKLLRLVLNNLFSNACEYTPEGGQIEIASPGADGALLQVANSAPDLDTEAVGHLFERFWRRDGARSDNAHSGLGLSLARACSRAIDLDLDAALDAGGQLVFHLSEKSVK